jgi:hypothetical protein
MSNDLLFIVSNGGGRLGLVGFTNTNWVHIVMVFNGSGSGNSERLKGYVDGVEQTLSFSGTIGSNLADIGSNSLEIGKQSTNYAQGNIANVGIWNRALTSIEVENIHWRSSHSSLLSSELTNLVSWYDLITSDISSTELITNGGFELDSNWDDSGSPPTNERSSNFANSGTFSRRVVTTSGLKGIQQTGISVNQDATYRLEFFVYGVTGTSIRVGFLSSGNWATTTGGDQLEQKTFGTSIGVWTKISVDFIPNGSGPTTSAIVYFRQNGDFEFYLDDVSLKLLNETPDSVGNNNGAVIGATVNTDSYSGSSPFFPRIPDKTVDSSTDSLNYGEVYSGRVLSFDGSNDRVVISDNDALELGTSDFSFSFWINLDDVSGTQTIFNRRLDSNNSVFIQVEDTGTLDFGASLSGSSVIRSQINSSIVSANQWYHIEWSVDRDSTTKIYINGVSKTLDTNIKDDGANNLDYGVDALIGAFNHASPSNFVDGKINNFKIFSSNALTQDQVRELYTKPETVLPTDVSASNLKLDLPMQEGFGTSVFDGSNNQNHGTITGATWAYAEEYGYQSSLVRSNTPMIFDGSNDHVVIPDNNSLSFGDGSSDSPFSISAWIFMNDASIFIILSKGIYNTTTAEFTFMVNGSDRLSLELYDESLASTYQLAASSDQLTTYEGKWIHVVATYTGVGGTSAKDGIKLFLNGSEISVTTASNGSYVAMENLTADVHIGRSSTSYANGIINEISLFNVALDADAVTALYNSGVPLLPTSDSGNYDNSSNLIGYWRNDGDTTWTDRSTNSNNGTVSGSPSTIIIPEGSSENRDNQGYYLSDTTAISNGIRLFQSGYVQVDNSEVLNNVFDGGGSAEAWIYVKGWGESNAGRIISKCGSGNANGWNLNVNSSGYLQFIVDWSTTDLNVFTGNGTLTLNNWHYVAVTYNSTESAGTNPVLYIDGVSKSLTVTSSVGTRVDDSGQKIRIGARGSDLDREFNGLVDEVRLYDKILSATEVLNNYNNAKGLHS